MRCSLIIGLLGLMTVSCAGGSETGNPAVALSVNLQMRSSNSGAVVLGKGTNQTIIKEAWVAFGAWQFLPEGQCGDAGAPLSQVGPGLMTVDLAQHGIQTQLELKVADYCGMTVALENKNSSLPAGAPQELKTHSIVIKGERADGVAFTLAFREGEELKLQSVSGTFGIDASTNTLLFSFDVYVWMKELDLYKADINREGTIRIDGDQNRQLLDAFENNLECAAELYEDSNRNGAVDKNDLLLARCAED